MRGKDNRFRRIFHLVELLDENRALGLQPFDDIFVMHDLMTDIDWRTVNTERLLDGIDGAHDARAETARRTEKNMELWLDGHAAMGPGFNSFRSSTVRVSSAARDSRLP